MTAVILKLTGARRRELKSTHPVFCNRPTHLDRRARPRRPVRRSLRLRRGLDRRLLPPLPWERDPPEQSCGTFVSPAETPAPRRVVMPNSLSRDIVYAVRMLVKSPVVTVAALISLALAIGANTLIFSAVNSILLTPLPFADPGRLVLIWGHDRQAGTS